VACYGECERIKKWLTCLRSLRSTAVGLNIPRSLLRGASIANSFEGVPADLKMLRYGFHILTFPEIEVMGSKVETASV
jgi:hypothetical protein